MSELKSSLKLPILDVSRPPSPSSSSVLLEACSKWGFFLISNHGIPIEMYTKMSSFADQIFGLPSETKLKIGPSSSLKSYTEYTPRFIASPFYEGLRVSGPDFFQSAHSSAMSLFGQERSEFRFYGFMYSETLEEYGDILTRLSKKIIEVILMSLGDGFDTKHEGEFKNCHGYLRIIKYAPPEEHELSKEVEGLGMHTDMTCLTILYPDNVGGLQVKSEEGEWLDVALCEGTLVVNIGDMLEAWSNGRLRSCEHRVVLRQPRSRLSLAFFWSFEDEKVIYTPEDVVGEGKVRLFRPFVCGDYLAFRQFDDEEKYDLVARNVRIFAGITPELNIS